MTYMNSMWCNKKLLVIFIILLNTSIYSHAFIGSEDVSFTFRNHGVCGNRRSKFYSVINASFDTCLVECGLRPMCKAINFIRRFGNYCELLLNNETTTGGAGCMYVPRKDMHFKGALSYACGCAGRRDGFDGACVCKEGQRCNLQDRTCSPSECKPFSDIERGQMVGNMYNIGSRFLLNCSYGHGRQDLSSITCQVNGELDPEPVCKDWVCPKGWVRYDTSCFYMSTPADGNRTFHDSEEVCVAMNSHLARIDTLEEDNYLRNELMKLNTGINYWLGMTRDSVNGSWYWIDNGDEPKYTNWYVGEPGTYERYVFMAVRTKLTWHDGNIHTFGFVCKKPASLL